MTQPASAPQKISVVIPTYERLEQTQRAAASVLDGNLDVLEELIIVDDGSVEPFSLADDHLLELRHKVRIIRHPENRGAAAARNTGVQAATSDWIAFLDSDDYWKPGRLVPIAPLLAESDGMTVWASGFELINHWRSQRSVRTPKTLKAAKDFAFGCWHNPGSTGIISRKAFDRVGRFDECLPRLEDYDWYLRFGLLGGHLAVHPSTAVVVEKHARAERMSVEIALDKVEAKLNERQPELPVQRAVNSYLALERAAMARYENRWGEMLSYLVQSYRLKPRLRLNPGI